MREQSAVLQPYTRDMQSRVERTVEQAIEAIDSLASSQAAPCSAAQILRMNQQKSGHKAAKLRRQIVALRDCTWITMPHPTGPGSARGGGRSVSAHWRRPHFRLQRHGPQNGLIKVVLIDGVVVNPTGGAIAEGPRHYRVTT